MKKKDWKNFHRLPKELQLSVESLTAMAEEYDRSVLVSRFNRLAGLTSSTAMWDGTVPIGGMVIGDPDLIASEPFWWLMKQMHDQFDMSAVDCIMLDKESISGQALSGSCHTLRFQQLVRSVYVVNAHVAGPFPYHASAFLEVKPRHHTRLRFTLNDEAEATVWILAHELGHYLKNTKQVPGENSELEVTRYSNGWLEKWRTHCASCAGELNT